MSTFHHSNPIPGALPFCIGSAHTDAESKTEELKYCFLRRPAGSCVCKARPQRTLSPSWKRTGNLCRGRRKLAFSHHFHVLAIGSRTLLHRSTRPACGAQELGHFPYRQWSSEGGRKTETWQSGKEKKILLPVSRQDRIRSHSTIHVMRRVSTWVDTAETVSSGENCVTESNYYSSAHTDGLSGSLTSCVTYPSHCRSERVSGLDCGS